MNKKEASTIIKNTLDTGFNEDSFKSFVSNLFKEYEVVDRVREGQYIKDSFRSFILKYKVIGVYKDAEGSSIDILEVALNKSSSLDLARTAQRNFIADYLKTNNKDAALVAFVSPKNDDWRLSLVRLEHTLEVIDEKLKTKEELTPAKRWSFLVGKNEGSHTAQSQFTELFVSDEKPNLNELELAFDIEKVTKEFFDKYTELYFQLTEHLDELLKKDDAVRKDFEEKEITTVDFAKKTLGQIVFLYFLQKKGWFGVPADKKWGEGPKKFIRALFTRRDSYGSNFFNDILEPLFYEALAQDRGKESIYSRLNNCRMPFLNGGLFEPMNGYHWETTDIIIPDELFSNENKTKEGDVGDGILDIFDRYNFTVNENEPLEKEVAVDPEMLGKVFENLLDIKDRKSKGAFYTPREIVHYMCQESLINYLETETDGDINKEDIEMFIRKGDRIIENDQIVIEKRLESEMKGREYKGEYKLLLPSSIVDSADKLNELLKDIKVADPAVGSGAFPLGMINEIVRARKILNIYGTKNLSDYDLKLHTISHSIYGVDIDPGAVEIAKLRLWLALVVEEKEPHPLPNLEHKIMQGNSLISEYEGIKLFDKKILSKYTQSDPQQTNLDIEGIVVESEQATLGLGQSASEQKMQELKVKIDAYIFESQRSKKETLKNDIDQLKWDLIESTLKEQGKENKLNEIKELRKKNIRPFFIWELEFSDVFIVNGGFDVVIGNPPYLKERDNAKFFKPVNDSIFGKKWHQGKMDFWYYFLHIGIDLIKEKGFISYITPRYWLNSKGASKLIQRVKQDLRFINILDIGKLKVFDDVVGHHMVTSYTNDTTRDSFVYKIIHNNLSDIFSENNTENISITTLNNKDIIKNNEIILEKFDFEESGCVPLGDIFYVSQGVVEAPDKINKKNIKSAKSENIKVGDGVFVLSEQEYDLFDNDVLRDNFKKYLSTKDVFKYSIQPQEKRYLMYSDSKMKESVLTDKNFESIKKHLDKFKDIITSSNAPYGLHRPRNNDFFSGEKIIFKGMFKDNEFTYDDKNYYFGMSFLSVIKKDEKYPLKYLLAILNSKFALKWFFANGKKRGVGVDIGVGKLQQFPVKDSSDELKSSIIELVDKILQITSSLDYNIKKEHPAKKVLEKQIDELIMDLYELPESKKELVRSFAP